MRLKELRLINNLSQIELAEEVNVSNRTISRYETGLREPDLTTFMALATIFMSVWTSLLDIPLKMSN